MDPLSNEKKLGKNVNIDLEPVSVTQARKILGSRAENLTDKQITEILSMLRNFCDKQIEFAISKNHNLGITYD